MTCRECDRPAIARGMCKKCYDARYRMLTSNRPSVFKPELWDKWWTARNAPVDAHTLRLREGIRQFRASLAVKG